MTFVAVDGLRFRYAGRLPPIIDGLSLRMGKGEIVGILGPSGSGKSTLLRLIAGLETPETGTIAIDGALMASGGVFCLDPDKRNVGMVFQDYALFPHLTVADNIAFGLHKLKRSARKERLQEMLELVQLTAFARRYPHQLSGGQQQRVALARALAPKPAVLLMDEPFSNLDAALKSAIRVELRHILRQAQITCLFVSHDQADLDAIGDRIIDLS